MSVFTNKHFVSLFLIFFIDFKYIDNILPLKFLAQLLIALIGYLMLFENFKYNQKRLDSKFIFIIILYTIINLVSPIINRNLTIGMIYTNISYLGFFIYINYSMGNFKSFISGVSNTLKLLIIINIFLALFSNASYMNIGTEKVFIGSFKSKNAISMVLVPSIAFILIESRFLYSRIRLRELMYCVLALIIMFISKSATSVVIGSILLIYILFFINKNIDIKKLLLLYLILFLGIVIFRVQEILFEDFIVNTLGKSITFTGRTYIWDFVISIIPDSWVIGYGRNDIILESSIIRNVTEAHNGLLEIVLCTGIIGLVLFIYIVYLSSKELNICKSNISNIISVAMFLYLCIGLAESSFTYNKVGFWILIIIGVNINKIMKQNRY